jgi:SAM-dependent methyltransferase
MVTTRAISYKILETLILFNIFFRQPKGPGGSMGPFEKPDKKEIERINRLQRELFDKIVHVFEPPLPQGVPERLEIIVKTAGILKGDVVLDVGTGTGILIPLIQTYAPGHVLACDLSAEMLKQLKKNYAGVATIMADVRDLTLPDKHIDVVLINACYPNIADKPGAFANISRMMKPGGRMIISHPLGKAFIDSLREGSLFPLDDFPEKGEADVLLAPYGFHILAFVDEPELYILLAVKQD